MNSHQLDSLAILSVEAFTVVTLIVFALRPAFRRIFGVVRAWQLWVLPPLMLLVTFASAMGFHVPVVHAPWFVTLSDVAYTPAIPAHEATGLDGSEVLAIVWMIGVGIAGLTVMFAQWRYSRTLKDARHIFSLNRIPVLRAPKSNIGPATVGAWRPFIVIPADFDSRYSAAERELILAHEVMHIDRHDGTWLLVAHVTTVLLWFHPLAWWALRGFRYDQELACDADVTALPTTDRLVYAEALMSMNDRRSPMLPVGNTWGYHHPLTERIAMLKKNRNGSLGLLAGYATLVLMGCGVLVTANAFAEPANSQVAETSVDYQLSLAVKLHGKVVATPTICMRKGEPGGISGGNKGKDGKPQWSMDFTVRPLSPTSAKIEVHGSMRQTNGTYTTLFPTVTTKLGETGTIDFFQLEGRPQVMITTVAGCPAAARSA